MNQLLLDKAARQRLAILLAGVDRPPAIPAEIWAGIIVGRIPAINVAHFAELCDVLFPRDVIGLLQQASIAAAIREEVKAIT